MFQLPPDMFYHYLELTVRCCLPLLCLPRVRLLAASFIHQDSSSTRGRLPCGLGVLQAACTWRVLVVTRHIPGVTLRQKWPTQPRRGGENRPSVGHDTLLFCPPVKLRMPDRFQGIFPALVWVGAWLKPRPRRCGDACFDRCPQVERHFSMAKPLSPEAMAARAGTWFLVLSFGVGGIF